MSIGRRIGSLFKGDAKETETAEPRGVSPAPAAAAAPPAGARAETLEVLRAKIVELSENRLGPDEIDPSAHLFDYGYVDSMSAATFLSFVEDRYGVSVPDVELVAKLSTLDAIVDFVEASRKS